MNESRLNRIEKAAEDAGMAGRHRKYICFIDMTSSGPKLPRGEDEIIGDLDGQPMSLAEWKRIATADDISLEIHLVDEKPGEDINSLPAAAEHRLAEIYQTLKDRRAAAENDHP